MAAYAGEDVEQEEHASIAGGITNCISTLEVKPSSYSVAWSICGTHNNGSRGCPEHFGLTFGNLVLILDFLVQP